VDQPLAGNQVHHNPGDGVYVYGNPQHNNFNVDNSSYRVGDVNQVNVGLPKDSHFVIADDVKLNDVKRSEQNNNYISS
jgi:hypothetical protein